MIGVSGLIVYDPQRLGFHLKAQEFLIYFIFQDDGRLVEVLIQEGCRLILESRFTQKESVVHVPKSFVPDGSGRQELLVGVVPDLFLDGHDHEA